MKSYISYQFGEALLNERPLFKSIFSSINYNQSELLNIQQRNLLILRLFKSLLIANPKLMETFEKDDGSALWMGIVLKLYDHSGFNNKFLVEMLSFLFDIMLNKNNVFTVLKCYSTRNLEEIPTINASRLGYLTVIQDVTLKSRFNDEIADILDIINGLLNNNENMKIFKENEGLTFLFNVMLSLPKTNNNFYTQTLTIFEQIISKFQYFLILKQKNNYH